jgi:copper chaperone CopZ
MINTVKRFTLIVIFSLSFLSLKAQFISATIGIDGLTCSACSFSTEKSIRKLNFVDSVYMELDKNIATVYFKKNIIVSIQQLAQKVYDAGFAVRSMYVLFNFSDISITNDYCLLYEKSILHFVKIEKDKKLNSIVSLKFIGEKFMQKKEYKLWKFYCNSSCSALITPDIRNEYFVTIP